MPISLDALLLKGVRKQVLTEIQQIRKGVFIQCFRLVRPNFACHTRICLFTALKSILRKITLRSKSDHYNTSLSGTMRSDGPRIEVEQNSLNAPPNSLLSFTLLD